MRIAVINSHPIQYFSPLYAYLSASNSLDVTVLYCSNFSLRGARDPGFNQTVTWDVDLLKGYRSIFMGEAAKTRVPGGFWSLVCPEVWREIRSGSYDAVLLHGHNYAVNLLALVAAKTKGVRVMMRGETHLGLQRQGFKRKARRLIMGLLYGQCDRCLAIGTANHHFYRAMGVREEKIFLVPYTVDNERFMASARINPEERRALRAKYGFSNDHTVILYASKFDRRKHPEDVLHAVAKLQAEGLKCALLIVGSGELESELRTLSLKLALRDIVFTGFVNQKELPRVYAASDIFTLPAQNEPWGLIVNEVMCAGLPVVVGEGVGCVPDLVKEGVTGYTHKERDVGGLAAAIRSLVLDPASRKVMGQNCRNLMKNWSYAQCLEGIEAAVY